MTVQQALQKIHAPKGVTSIIAGISSNDFSVLPHSKGNEANLATAEEQVKIHQKRLDECQSDWSYWSILGDLEYWESVRDILEAASITGGILPDVDAPDLEGLVVMDAIGRVRDFGAKVLHDAKESVRLA